MTELQPIEPNDSLATGTAAGELDASVAATQEAAPEPTSLLREERGQVSILLMFGTLALVLLAGLIFNTAKQTIRRVEMQGAADASAISTGAWVARGMNLCAFNNAGMADITAVMVVVHSFYQTAYIMSSVVLPAMIAAFSAGLPWTAAIVAYLQGWETSVWQALRAAAQAVDNLICKPNSGLGWKILKAADMLNQAIKVGFGPIAESQGISLAKANTASFGLVFPGNGLGAGNVPMPQLPIARGDQKLIAQHGAKCPFPALSALALIPMVAAPLSFIPAVAIYYVFTAINWASLGAFNTSSGSGNNQAALEHLEQNPAESMGLIDQDLNKNNGVHMMAYLDAHPDLKKQFTKPADDKHPKEWVDLKAFRDWLAWHPKEAAEIAATIQEEQAQQQASQAANSAGGGGGGGGGGIAPLSWPNDPPRPMVLVDNPQLNGKQTTTKTNPDLKKVYKYLQFLSIAMAEMTPSRIAPARMVNPRQNLGVGPLNGGWITYAQANVFNPTEWDMFSQDWRTQLVQARLLDEKLKFIPMFKTSPNGSADLANTH